MGDRGNIVLNYGDDKEIYLYTHWSGSLIPSLLHTAIHDGRSRWDDPPYLGRIIFQTLLDGDDGLTGYGLDVEQGDGGIDAKVFMQEQRLVVGEQAFTFEEYARLTDLDNFTED